MKLVSLTLSLSLALLSPVDAAAWSSLRDPAGQYTIDLPTSSFRQEASDQAGHLTFSEIGGDAILDIYGGRNLKRLEPAAFIAELSHAPRIKDITYTARGRTWFASSGHYIREGGDADSLIYYAKFVFSDDLARFTAFEISYPPGEKRRMDPLVTHLEKSLRLTH